MVLNFRVLIRQGLNTRFDLQTKTLKNNASTIQSNVWFQLKKWPTIFRKLLIGTGLTDKAVGDVGGRRHGRKSPRNVQVTGGNNYFSMTRVILIIVLAHGDLHTLQRPARGHVSPTRLFASCDVVQGVPGFPVPRVECDLESESEIKSLFCSGFANRWNAYGNVFAFDVGLSRKKKTGGSVPLKSP